MDGKRIGPSFDKFKADLQLDVGQALFPLIEDILHKSYSAGYCDAVNTYQAAIDGRGLRKMWDLTSFRAPEAKDDGE